MSKDSKIQWTDHTFNPWIGCTKVSPGCAHCYAETQDNFRKWTTEGWGRGKPRKRTSPSTWHQVRKWNPSSLPRRPRVFCASLADWLDDEVPIGWLADLLDLIRQTSDLDWLMLTKRPENWHARLANVNRHMRSLFDAETDSHHPTYDFVFNWLQGDAPSNIWLGASVEDQQRANERIPALLDIPAHIRFLSVEPQLEHIHLGDAFPNPFGYIERGIHWVICGGESGNGARPFDIEWARTLRDECDDANIAFFMKQLGALVHDSFKSDEDAGIFTKDQKGGNPDEWPEDLRIRQFPEPAPCA